MENIKNKFIIFCQKKCRTFLDFKITAVLLVLWTISILIEDVIPRAYFDLQEFFFRFLFLMVLSAVFAETCFKGKWKAMLVFYLLFPFPGCKIYYQYFQHLYDRYGVWLCAEADIDENNALQRDICDFDGAFLCECTGVDHE